MFRAPGCSTSAICVMLPLASFTPAMMLGTSHRRARVEGSRLAAGSAGNVVENDWLVDGFGDGAEMAILAFLRGLVVVGRSGEDRVHARPRSDFFRFGHCFLRGVRGRAGHDGHASGGDFDGHVDHVQPFVVRERGRLAGGAARNQKVNSGFDLPCDQIAQSSFIHGAVGSKRRHEGSTTSSELHGIRITPSERRCICSLMPGTAS